MKRIGLIGGLSWQSTVDYYRIINEESAKRLGGLNNVESIVYSVNLNEMLEHMGKGEVEILGGKFAAVGKKLEEAWRGPHRPLHQYHACRLCPAGGEHPCALYPHCRCHCR